MRRLALRRTTILMLGPVGVSALTFSARALAVKPQDTAPQAPRTAAPPSTSYYDREREDGTQAFDPFSTATGAAISLPQPLANVSLQSQYAEYTGYGDLTYRFTRKLDLQVGLRYSQNNQLYTQGQGGLLGGGIFSSLASTSQDSTTTFLVIPSYKIDPNNLLYVRIASGYRPGSPNALPPAGLSVGVPATFQPDTLVNYEVGYKAALINRHLTLDLSAFYIDWKAVQVLTRSGLFLAEGNGGAAISKGLEATITYTPVRGITLSNNVAYADAQLTANAPGVGKGDMLPYVPRWSENFNIDYDWTLLSGWHAYVGSSVHFIGSRASVFAISGVPGFQRPRIPAYETLDVRAGIVRNGHALNLYAKKLTNSRGITDLVGLQADAG
jgi:iron complex outermembrane receptor protein